MCLGLQMQIFRNYILLEILQTLITNKEEIQRKSRAFGIRSVFSRILGVNAIYLEKHTNIGDQVVFFYSLEIRKNYSNTVSRSQ